MRKSQHRLKEADIRKINEAYIKKITEYKKMSLEDLHTLYNDPLKKVGGTYKKALLDVIEHKLQQKAIAEGNVVKIASSTDDTSGTEQTDNSVQPEQQVGPVQETIAEEGSNQG